LVSAPTTRERVAVELDCANADEAAKTKRPIPKLVLIIFYWYYGKSRPILGKSVEARIRFAQTNDRCQLFSYRIHKKTLCV